MKEHVAQCRVLFLLLIMCRLLGKFLLSCRPFTYLWKRYSFIKAMHNCVCWHLKMASVPCMKVLSWLKPQSCARVFQTACALQQLGEGLGHGAAGQREVYCGAHTEIQLPTTSTQASKGTFYSDLIAWYISHTCSHYFEISVKLELLCWNIEALEPRASTDK